MSDGERKTRHRSPNFPSIGLNEALAKVRIVYQRERRAPSREGVIIQHLGFASKTGPAGRALSALGQYGLLDLVDSKYRVSDSAFKMLELSEDNPDRERLLKQAALKPKIFGKVFSYYAGTLPSDANLREHLIFDEDFNPTSVDQFIRIFKTTIEFAKLTADSYNAEDDIQEEANGGDDVNFGGEAMTDSQLKQSDALTSQVRASISKRQEGGNRISGQQSPALTDTPLAANETELKFNISKDSKARIIFSGRVTQEAIELLAEMLNIQKRTFPKESEVKAMEATGSEMSAQHSVKTEENHRPATDE